MVDTPKPKAQKIGMVVYFDWRKSMKSMSNEQKGKLFDYILSILNYSQHKNPITDLHFPDLLLNLSENWKHL